MRWKKETVDADVCLDGAADSSALSECVALAMGFD
jgi:hypothetical protein